MAVNGTTQDRSVIGEILKNVYSKDMLESMQNEVLFFKDASRHQMPLDGTDYITAVHLGRNATFAARPVTAALPNGTSELVKNGALRAARGYTGFQVDNELVKLSKRDEASFVRGLDLTMDGPKQWLQKQLERMSLGVGTGILATLTAVTTTSAVMTVDSTRYLEEGMVIDGWSTATSTTKSVDSGTILSIDSETQLTMSASTSLASGGVLRFEDNAADVSGLTHYEMNGIQQIADDATNFMGLAYATYRRWRASVIDGTGLDIGPTLSEQLAIKMRQNGAGDIYDTVWTHPCQTYGLIYGPNGSYSDARFTAGDAKDVGADGDPSITVAGKRVKVRTSIDASKTAVVAFCKKDLFYGELNGVELEEFGENGMSLLPAMDNAGNVFPAVRGWYSWRGNLGCLRRNSFGRIKLLNVPSGL